MTTYDLIRLPATSGGNTRPCELFLKTYDRESGALFEMRAQPFPAGSLHFFRFALPSFLQAEDNASPDDFRRGSECFTRFILMRVRL